MYFCQSNAIICTAASRCPTMGSARNGDNMETTVNISTHACSTIYCNMPIKDLKYKAASSLCLELISSSGTWPIICEFSDLWKVYNDHQSDQLCNVCFCITPLTYLVRLFVHAHTPFSIFINCSLTSKYTSGSPLPSFIGYNHSFKIIIIWSDEVSCVYFVESSNKWSSWPFLVQYPLFCQNHVVDRWIPHGGYFCKHNINISFMGYDKVIIFHYIHWIISHWQWCHSMDEYLIHPNLLMGDCLSHKVHNARLTISTVLIIWVPQQLICPQVQLGNVLILILLYSWDVMPFWFNEMINWFMASKRLLICITCC